MKKKIFVVILLAFSSLSILGQNSNNENTACSDKAVEKISSRGIKIGAKIDDILSIFASTEEEKNQIRNSSSGPKKTNIGYEFFGASAKPDDKRFEGISSYVFYFLDGRVVGFSVIYTKPDWKDIDQFTNKIIEFFDLPDIKLWNKQNSNVNYIQCGDYRIGASLAGTYSSLDIYNLQTGKILEQREQKLKEEIREKDIKEFKP